MSYFFLKWMEEEEKKWQEQQEAEDKLCPYCGNPLPEGHVKTLDYYFKRYFPSRLRAVKALRKDRPMPIREAVRQIDEVFDKHLGKKRRY